MGSLSPRSLKQVMNMHRLAKAILHRDTEDADLKDLVVWVLLSWRYSLQLTWWLAVRLSTSFSAL